jgi:hypothetical protein
MRRDIWGEVAFSLTGAPSGVDLRRQSNERKQKLGLSEERLIRTSVVHEIVTCYNIRA